MSRQKFQIRNLPHVIVLIFFSVSQTPIQKWSKNARRRSFYTKSVKLRIGGFFELKLLDGISEIEFHSF